MFDFKKMKVGEQVRFLCGIKSERAKAIFAELCEIESRGEMMFFGSEQNNMLVIERCKWNEQEYLEAKRKGHVSNARQS